MHFPLSSTDYEPEGAGVLMRLYYPTSSNPPIKLLRPRYFSSSHYCHGLLHFIINVPEQPWWVRLLARAVGLSAYCTSFVTDTIPASLDAPPSCGVNDESGRRLPVVVFSHGLAGNRNLYAALCTSLASQGYLVAAIEHRDGSASCAALVNKATDGVHGVAYQQYIHTDGNFAWRREQVAKRAEEFSAAIEALSAAADGRGAPRNVFPSSRFDVSILNGAVDVSRLVAMGHSFGGATVMTAAGNKAIKRAVLLDPWTEPLGDVVRAASVPTLVMNSHKWPEDLRGLYGGATAAWLEAEMAGVKHQDFCDQPFRMPYSMNMLKGLKLFEGRLKDAKGVKGVDLHGLFDFKLALMHLFFEEVDRAEDSGGAFGDELAASLHEGGVELAGRYRGKMEIKIRSKSSSSYGPSSSPTSVPRFGAIR